MGLLYDQHGPSCAENLERHVSPGRSVFFLSTVTNRLNHVGQEQTGPVQICKRCILPHLSTTGSVIVPWLRQTT